jgi:hypothetical protein
MMARSALSLFGRDANLNIGALQAGDRPVPSAMSQIHSTRCCSCQATEPPASETPHAAARARRLNRRRVRAHLGQRQFRSALETVFSPPLTDASLIEIGPLNLVVEARVGSTNPKLRSGARRLHNARNRLAHLEPLRFVELRELISACEVLG